MFLNFIPGYAKRDPSNLAIGATASATSEMDGNPAANVVDGAIRTLPDRDGDIVNIIEDDGVKHVTHAPKGPSRGWVSNPHSPLPQSVIVRLAEPREASEVRVVFDSDFFLPRVWVHHTVPTTLVRSYRIETSRDGIAWEPVAEVSRNVRRLAVHKFTPCKILAIRVTVDETYGDASARIFEIGLW